MRLKWTVKHMDAFLIHIQSYNLVAQNTSFGPEEKLSNGDWRNIYPKFVNVINFVINNSPRFIDANCKYIEINSFLMSTSSSTSQLAFSCPRNACYTYTLNANAKTIC